MVVAQNAPPEKTQNTSGANPRASTQGGSKSTSFYRSGSKSTSFYRKMEEDNIGPIPLMWGKARSWLVVKLIHKVVGW